MANDDRTSEVVLKYKVDQASIGSVKTSVASIYKEFKTLEGNVGSVSATTKNLETQIKALDRADSIDKLAKQFAELGVQAQRSGSYLEELQVGLKDVGASTSEIAKATLAFEDYERAAIKAAAATESAGSGGGGITGASQLRRTGSALNQLGLGAIGEPIQKVGDVLQVAKELQSASGDVAGAFSSVLAEVGPLAPALGLGAIALGGLSLAVSGFIQIIKDGKDAVDKAEVGLVDYYKLVGTDTSHDIKKKLSAVQGDKDANDRAIGINTDKINALVADVTKDMSPVLAKGIQGGIKDYIASGGTSTTGKEALAALDSTLNIALPGIHSLLEATGKLTTDSNNAAAKINQYNQALNDTGVKANDAREALLKSTDQFAADRQLEYSLSKLTVDSAKDRIASLKATMAGETAARDILVQSGDKSLEVQDKIQAYNDALTSQGRELGAVTKLLPELTAKQGVEILKKRDDAIQQLEDKASQDRIDLQKRTADKIADIIQKEIDANDAALVKLQEKTDSLTLNAGRENAKDDRKAQQDDIDKEIKARRQYRDDLTQHLRKVQDIQNSFLSKERDALLFRRFDQLFQIQEDKKLQGSQEDKAYAERQQDRDKAFKDEQQDTTRHRTFERNERRIALQQQLNDASAAYQRELNLNRQAKENGIRLANAAYQNDLTNLNNKLVYEEGIKRAGASRDIALLNETEATKMIIYRKYLAEYNAIAGRVSGQQYYDGTSGGFTYNSVNSSGSTLRRFANTGSFNRGDVGMINDKNRSQRESINGVRMPPGIGLFVATGAGRVTDDGSSGGVHIGSMPITINEAKTPQLTKQAIYNGVLEALDKLTGGQP